MICQSSNTTQSYLKILTKAFLATLNKRIAVIENVCIQCNIGNSLLNKKTDFKKGVDAANRKVFKNILDYMLTCMWMCIHVCSLGHIHIHRVSVSLFTQVYDMLDLDPASWASLAAQLVRASVQSAECRGFKSHLRQLIFIFSLPWVSFFLLSVSFHLKSHHVPINTNITEIAYCLCIH